MCAQYLASAAGWSRFVSMQNHHNLVYREEEREMIPLCRDLGVGLIPWSPLARGLLAGNRERGGQRNTVRVGTDPPAESLLAWLLHQPAVTAPIVGATKLAHLDDGIAALDVSLSEQEQTQLAAPYRPHPVCGYP